MNRKLPSMPSSVKGVPQFPCGPSPFGRTKTTKLHIAIILSAMFILDARQLLFLIALLPDTIMKSLILSLILIAAISPLAQAQVHFDSGSATPRDAAAGTRHVARHDAASARRTVGAGKVRCRDGSRHVVRVCARHGGVAGR